MPEESAALRPEKEEAGLRAALDRLVRAWDNGADPDPSNWKALDREINAALAAARAALAAPVAGLDVDEVRDVLSNLLDPPPADNAWWVSDAVRDARALLARLDEEATR